MQTLPFNVANAREEMKSGNRNCARCHVFKESYFKFKSFKNVIWNLDIDINIQRSELQHQAEIWQLKLKIYLLINNI